MAKRREAQFKSHRDCQGLTGLVLEHLPGDRSLGHVWRYRKDVDVWRPDDRADSVFFLRRGQVAVMVGDARGNEVIVRVIGAGEPFGELCFCSARGDVRGTSARAVVESEAVEIKLKDFLGYLQEDSAALAALVFTMCERLTESEHRIEVLAHRGAEERLGRLLLQLAGVRGRAGAESKGEVVLPVSHEELAQMAAMSRPHVTITMGRFRRRGFVR
ncbi:MAG: Crp/Fnr family transcriptional regulator [Acidobacteria bacterium]|nr:Crp/Fnr family transcriptional regulator [Acidobacteriota bacterium]